MRSWMIAVRTAFLSTALLSWASCTKGPFQVHVTVTGADLGSVSSDDPPFNCASDCILSIAAGTPVVLHPVAVGPGVFQGWSGGCSGTGDCHLEAKRNTEVTASFAPRSFSIHIQVAGEAGGAVQLPDGSQCQDTCDVLVRAGQHIHLDALPHEDSYFVSWSGACSGEATGCDLDAADVSVAAHFGRKVRLEVTGVTPSTLGRVTSNPPGIDCGQTCSAWIRPGLKLSLTAQTSDEMWRFRGWSDATCSGSDCEIVVDADTSIEARFSSVHSWSRSLKFGGATLKAKSDGGLTVALSSDQPQDFGAGVVAPKVYSRRNLFVTRYSKDGSPLFTSVLGGTADIVAPEIQDRSGGDIAVAVIVTNSASATGDESVDFGNYKATVKIGAPQKVWFTMSGAGEVTGAGPLDPNFATSGVVPSATAAYGLADRNAHSIARLRPDWSNEWVLTNSNQPLKFAASQVDDVLWVASPDVPAEMNCQGGPLTTGALMKVEADGTCRVAWQYPDTFTANLVRAPGGAPVIYGSYDRGFEFAGSQLPDAMFSSRLQGVRLRFDADGNPKWGRIVFEGGGESYQTVSDISALKDGQLLITGKINGICELSPTDPTPEKLYLAVYDSETGALTWSHTIPKYQSGSSTPAFFEGSFVPFVDGRTALYGFFTGGGLDFGGGPLYGNSKLYLAVYDF